MALVTAGCVAQKPAVNVDQNRVHFSRINLTLEMDSDYSYHDLGKDNNFSFFDNGGTLGTGVTTEKHLFYKGGAVEEQSWIHIAFSTLNRTRTYYHPVSFKHRNDILRTGKEVLDGVELKYAVYAVTDNDDRCLLQKYMAKTVGASNNMMLEVVYLEEAGYRSDFPYRCSDWKNPQKLTPAQEARLDQFLENSRREVKAASE